MVAVFEECTYERTFGFFGTFVENHC